jgi:hypothetical protein
MCRQKQFDQQPPRRRELGEIGQYHGRQVAFSFRARADLHARAETEVLVQTL